MEKVNFGVREYTKPTPKNFRRLGDGLLAVSAMGMTYSIVEELTWLNFTFLGIGIIGKFLTNFFAEKNVKIKVPDEKYKK